MPPRRIAPLTLENNFQIQPSQVALTDTNLLVPAEAEYDVEMTLNESTEDLSYHLKSTTNQLHDLASAIWPLSLTSVFGKVNFEIDLHF